MRQILFRQPGPDHAGRRSPNPKLSWNLEMGYSTTLTFVPGVDRELSSRFMKHFGAPENSIKQKKTDITN